VKAKCRGKREIVRDGGRVTSPTKRMGASKVAVGSCVSANPRGREEGELIGKPGIFGGTWKKTPTWGEGKGGGEGDTLPVVKGKKDLPGRLPKAMRSQSFYVLWSQGEGEGS